VTSDSEVGEAVKGIEISNPESVCSVVSNSLGGFAVPNDLICSV
jgi:hypothetical protein